MPAIRPEDREGEREPQHAPRPCVGIAPCGPRARADSAGSRPRRRPRPRRRREAAPSANTCGLRDAASDGARPRERPGGTPEAHRVAAASREAAGRAARAPAAEPARRPPITAAPAVSVSRTDTTRPIASRAPNDRAIETGESRRVAKAAADASASPRPGPEDRAALRRARIQAGLASSQSGAEAPMPAASAHSTRHRGGDAGGERAADQRRAAERDRRCARPQRRAAAARDRPAT